MTQHIDPVKLKAAAEHLEWVLRQYPDESSVQALLQELQPLIEDAKAGRVSSPIANRNDIPSRWAVSAEGLYRAYVDPDIEGAYVAFAIEMEGGLTEDGKEINAILENIKRKIASEGKS